jgi:Patched family
MRRGASILVGGLSTMLGVAPLAFSTSGVMRTVFISFCAMITLGISHGLILLPVLLSYCGPEVCVKPHHNKPQHQKGNSGKGNEPHEHESVQEVSPVTIDVDSSVEHIEALSPISC